MTALIVHRYFWPDTPPYASMLRSIATHLQATDRDIEVYTAQPSYGSSKEHASRPLSEQLDAVSVRRARLLPESKSNMFGRAVNLLLFSAQVFFRILMLRPSIVMVATTPPILVAFAATLAARLIGAGSIYHCQDIYPEVAEATGAMQNRRLARMLRWLDTMTMRRATSIVVLSSDMKQTVALRDASLERKTSVINNFVLDPSHSTNGSAIHEPVSLPVSLRDDVDRFRILFAGNLGNFQGLDNVVAAAVQAASVLPAIDWIFLGKGQAQQRLEIAAGPHLGRTIFFEGHVSPVAAEAAIASADAALVSLSRGVIKAAYPSKTLTCLAAGTPLVVVAELDSELARSVVTEGIGVVAEPDVPASLLSAISVLFEDSDLERMRETCQRFGAKASSRSARLEDWDTLFEAVEGRRS